MGTGIKFWKTSANNVARISGLKKSLESIDRASFSIPSGAKEEDRICSRVRGRFARSRHRPADPARYAEDLCRGARGISPPPRGEVPQRRPLGPGCYGEAPCLRPAGPGAADREGGQP